ncbi:plastocyanin/azurin family copper-binding protein [Bacillus kexueae]|uniref:plastocyanin/azurin family copper-binding protein n=1 Tax=Aeribacillus kexueae TaxID=2078952 RepID=UPI001FAFD67A
MLNINRLFYTIFTALAFSLLLAGCSSTNESDVSKEDETKVEVSEATSTMEDIPGSNNTEDYIVEVSAFEMGYDPNIIQLKQGQEYELIMKNDGQVFHDLTSKGLDVEIIYMSEMADHPETVSFIWKMLGGIKVYADEGHDEGMMNSIHLNTNSEDVVKIKFIPKETGEFEFYCTVPGHKEAGMVGKFIVQ